MLQGFVICRIRKFDIVLLLEFVIIIFIVCFYYLFKTRPGNMTEIITGLGVCEPSRESFDRIKLPER